MIDTFKAGDRVVFTKDVLAGDGFSIYKGDRGIVTKEFSGYSTIKINRFPEVMINHKFIEKVEEKPVRVNRLLAKIGKQLPIDVVQVLESEGRLTGETTGYLLSFLGQVISNPNKWHPIRKNSCGSRFRGFELAILKTMVKKLQLDFIEFRQSDCSVMFRLYEDFNGKCDMCNREVL